MATSARTDDLFTTTGIAASYDAPLAPYTSLKVGGPARVLVHARTPDEVSRVLNVAHDRGEPYVVIGGGSNVVVSDRGIDAIVVHVTAATGRHAGVVTGGESVDGTDVVDIEVEAGTPTAALARWAAREGLGGVEWACGIPGTVGGAIAGNAGAYGGDMASVVRSVRVWTPLRRDVTVTHAQLSYGYRSSVFKHPGNGVVLSARLRLRREPPSVLLERIATFEARRRDRQPTERSCGSVFRNPPGDHAGRLLELVGMKGRRRGDAQVSEIHANWIVNRGHATADDVVALMREGRAAVWERCGVRLELEVLLMGEWPTSQSGEPEALGIAAARPGGEGSDPVTTK